MRNWIIGTLLIGFILLCSMDVSEEIETELVIDTNARIRAEATWKEYMEPCTQHKPLFSDVCNRVREDFNRHQALDSRSKVFRRVLNKKWDRHVRPYVDPVVGSFTTFFTMMHQGFNMTGTGFVLMGDVLRESRGWAPFIPYVLAPYVLTFVVLSTLWMVRYMCTHLTDTISHTKTSWQVVNNVTEAKPSPPRYDSPKTLGESAIVPIYEPRV